jgi:hypothetical protein
VWNVKLRLACKHDYSLKSENILLLERNAGVECEIHFKQWEHRWLVFCSAF